MVATVKIYEFNGPTGTVTSSDKTTGNVRMKKAGNPTVDYANPLVKPATGVDWSFNKFLALFATVGPAVQIVNPQVYTDGAAPTTGTGNWTGVTLYGKANPTYATPAQQTATGTDFADMFGYTSSSPLALGSPTHTGTGVIGSYLELKMKVGTTVTQGLLSSETLTFQYDEI